MSKNEAFANAVPNITITDEIEKVITNCPHLEVNECIQYCSLAKVCYTYYTGDNDNTCN